MAAVTIYSGSGGSSVSRPVQFSLISLPDPGSDGASTANREFMLATSSGAPAHAPPRPAAATGDAGKAKSASYDICEVQAVLPHSGKYASYFVGSRIISNPALHVTTRVDPLFFALAHFQRALGQKGDAAAQLEKWQPWDQALADMPSPILRALNLDPNLNLDGIGAVGQLGHLLEVSDMCGDDLLLCKFSEERAMKWLTAKFERAVEGLRRRLLEKKRRGAEKKEELSQMQGGSGAFSSSFTVADEKPKAEADGEEKKEESSDNATTDAVLSQGDEKSIRVGALQLICDYLPTEWKSKLAKEVGLTDDDWMCKKKTKSDAEEGSSGDKRSRASWEGNLGQEDADALYQYTNGTSGKAASVTPGENKKDVKNAQSVGLKRLAKVNTKGMKSISSFFGAGKKRAKKA
ncbi:hypothetical protein ACHAXT_010076 [Thalassiosira profunda]